ncbi:pyridoxamine 5'-phosphate oxidase [Luteolibacter yonseiensis]|uniref:Pyridoxamine 5'-phosphate oxidase n=1 Tax=Luteolibacter yonseiensis TaxID=1144680 RepID=A0A934R3B6_9BACT|nr:pyridoxamine 5'-phosphate oxidase [Luteolibacter yonseiensis]MBK1817623.1 pyridoxamine 5'-phosphate oxidase [Luteolibacter yonseiensis]
MDLADFRKEYSDRGLKRAELDADPIAQFSNWFAQAIEFGVHEPNAMTVATVDENGMPFQRTLLLKNVDSRGFTFFTNYQSRKAAQMEKNQQVCLLFPWLTLERQIIVQGEVEKVGREESQRYFSSRPRESQIGAWVSNQSEVIASRDVLTQQLAEIREKFQDGEIPLPPHWGGYLLKPRSIEFWQGGPARLHDRFLYQLKNGQWTIDRLSP